MVDLDPDTVPPSGGALAHVAANGQLESMDRTEAGAGRAPHLIRLSQ